MQIRFRIPFLTLITAIVLLASCSKSNKQGKMIPKDAAFVLHLNGESLNSKLPWEEVKQNALFQKMYADSSMPAFVKSVLDNPDNSGIDIKNDLIIFVQKDSLGGYIGIEGTVKDADKFKSFNTAAAEGGSASEADGISFISRAPMSIGWNKDKFVYIVDAPALSKMDEGMPKDWPMPGDSMRKPDVITPVAPRDLLATCKSIFALKESNSLGKDAKFTDLVKTKGDVHFWFNAESFYKGSAGIAALSMLKMDELFTGNITAATASFDNGKISVEARSYAGKELTKLFKKYSGSGINEDMIKRIPAKDVAAVFALNFKPEGIKELVKLMGMEGFANIGLAFMGFTLDDFVKANKGDLVVAVSNLRVKHDSANNIVRTKTDLDFLFGASVGDKDAFNQLIAAGERLGKERMNDSVPFPVNYKTDGKYFAIGNSKENVDKYIAGSNNSFDFLEKISGQPFGGYINLQYILKAMESEVGKDSADRELYNASLGFWDNVYMKGGDFKGDAMTQTIEINLLDKNSNSLKQLNQYVGKIGKLMDVKKIRRPSDMPLDTMTMRMGKNPNF